jgi:hypothetical protein
MGNGLGELGFWLAVGIVIAAMIVSGAIKERDKERERQATLRAVPDHREQREETLRALARNGGENTAEILAYLRERDAAWAARAEGAQARMELTKKMGERRGLAFVGAFMVATFSFIGGLAASTTLHHPALPQFVISPQTGRAVFQSPPPPTGWASFAPLGVMLGVWVAGLIIAVLIVAWGLRQPKNDAQPDA